ncbi:hypothetical protein ACFCW6_00460 [Streptomyces sp. NPDC056333]|uniref:hypothetical protein n=1 Tax=Streptomyces sp. NPDC056333 TaxID=3345786 RepID=UPI0035E12D22
MVKFRGVWASSGCCVGFGEFGEVAVFEADSGADEGDEVGVRSLPFSEVPG